MDVSVKTLLLVIVVVYFVFLTFLGFLHDQRWNAQERLSNVEQTLDSNLHYIGEEAGLLFHNVKTEITRSKTQTSSSASSTPQAEPQTKTRSHRRKTEQPKDNPREYI